VAFLEQRRRWSDDSNDPPSPFIKQRFTFVNIAAHGPRPVTAEDVHGVPSSKLTIS